jgi:hypothetical protein
VTNLVHEGIIFMMENLAIRECNCAIFLKMKGGCTWNFVVKKPKMCILDITT